MQCYINQLNKMLHNFPDSNLLAVKSVTSFRHVEINKYCKYK